MSLPCLETTNLKHVCADLTSLVHPLLMWGEKRERGSSCYLFYRKTNLLFSGSNFLFHTVTLLRSMFRTGFCFTTLVIKSLFRRAEWEDRGTTHNMLWYCFFRIDQWQSFTLLECCTLPDTRNIQIFCNQNNVSLDYFSLD